MTRDDIVEIVRLFILSLGSIHLWILLNTYNLSIVIVLLSWHNVVAIVMDLLFVNPILSLNTYFMQMNKSCKILQWRFQEKVSQYS